MSRISQPSDGRGSLRDIQILINNPPASLLTNTIKKKLGIKSRDIEWISPLKDDDYAEYRDESFLEKLGIDSLQIPISDFWPSRGPQWDALGKGNKEVFLIEAKANIPEIVSPASGANGKSLELIHNSLTATKSYLGIDNDVDWSGKFYQYTNRLAHLYYLRVLNEIPAYLIFVYFVGDKGVNGPEITEEWTPALSVMKNYLGIEKHKLSAYILDVFVHMKEIMK